MTEVTDFLSLLAEYEKDPTQDKLDRFGTAYAEQWESLDPWYRNRIASKFFEATGWELKHETNSTKTLH